MAKYRVTANLHWDIEADSLEEAIKRVQEACLVLDADKRNFSALASAKASAKASGGGRTFIGEFPIEEVLPYIGDIYHDFVVDGRPYRIKMRRKRYHIMHDSHECVCCGIRATVVRLERTGGSHNYHLGFYGVVGTIHVLLTKDHIVPLSKGGTSDLSNLQVMCETCNLLKGSELLTLEQVRELRAFHDRVGGFNIGQNHPAILQERLRLAALNQP